MSTVDNIFSGDSNPPLRDGKKVKVICSDVTYEGTFQGYLEENGKKYVLVDTGERSSCCWWWAWKVRDTQPNYFGEVPQPGERFDIAKCKIEDINDFTVPRYNNGVRFYNLAQPEGIMNREQCIKANSLYMKEKNKI